MLECKFKSGYSKSHSYVPYVTFILRKQVYVCLMCKKRITPSQYSDWIVRKHKLGGEL